jgi:hypothetical protein
MATAIGPAELRRPALLAISTPRKPKPIMLAGILIAWL